jgi:phosphinothricin acetyltransferase
MARIRLAAPSDAAQLAEIYGPVVARTAISFEVTPPTANMMEERVASNLGHAPWLCLVDDSRVLGFSYGSKHHDRAAYQWSVDVTVYVRGGHHRSGIGRALYTSLFALLKMQGFYAAHAGITLPNAASVGLHESLGFRPVGVYPSVGYKLGAWHDVGWWQLALRERTGVPAPPLSPGEAETQPGWQDALQSGVQWIRP